MNIDNWKYFYKVCYDSKHIVTTNMLYTPMVNLENSIMCMIWDETNPYQKNNTKLSKELVDFFFKREIENLTVFQKFDWCPKIFQIDYDKRNIFIEFSGETLNNIVTDSSRNLDLECPDWKNQIFSILQDIVNYGYYKMALYPHCFFLIDGKIKTFDFYSCINYTKERYLEKSLIEGLIGRDSVERFNAATVDNSIDFEIFFKNTMLNHLGNTWVDNPFPDFYKKLFND